MIPNDPIMLLSYINTQLRDSYHSFDDFCKSMNLEGESILSKLSLIDYKYDDKINQFI